jgi:hypothetical protein
MPGWFQKNSQKIPEISFQKLKEMVFNRFSFIYGLQIGSKFFKSPKETLDCVFFLYRQ